MGSDVVMRTGNGVRNLTKPGIDSGALVVALESLGSTPMPLLGRVYVQPVPRLIQNEH